jgi:hypothetical protein
LQQARAWVFRARLLALVTIRFLHRREWVAQVAHVRQVAQAVLVAPAVLVRQGPAHLVQVAQVDQVVQVVLHRVLLVPVLLVQVVHQVQLREPVDSLVRVVDQAQAVVAA